MSGGEDSSDSRAGFVGEIRFSVRLVPVQRHSKPGSKRRSVNPPTISTAVKVNLGVLGNILWELYGILIASTMAGAMKGLATCHGGF